ncbi:MAG TPA: hypothetical protein VFE15_04565 [Marmoricola sp.]|jgi:uncharacterized protein involved in exopolysaccharide biosynthesis|nr:hypothetical protein [Marmoricola sp.]
MIKKLRAARGALAGVDDLRRRVGDLERELIRLSPQVAALEVRIADLGERIEAAPAPGTDTDRAEARSLVEEVRAEHARVRARISAATVFEERLRVVEDKLQA